MNELRVNGDRLWNSLMEMARLGATPKGGVCRLALSETDLKARDLLSEWCWELGMEIRFDAMGNQFARLAGKDPEADPIMLGSHLDSQPTGGKFDGALGVLAGLEVIRALADAGMRPNHPIELVNWTNEEGARFAPAMIGSGVFAGAFSLEEVHQIKDQEGINIKEAIEGIGHLGPNMDRSPYHASLELHIEQGPVLEQKESILGIVTGVQGMRWYECRVKGKSAHAGSTPMDMRNDPVQVVTRLLVDCYQMIAEDPEAKMTIGTLKAYPGAINTVPELITFNLDIRHPKTAGLEGIEKGLKSLIARHEMEADDIELVEVWKSAPVAFHPACIDAVACACELLKMPAMKLVSGAGHDSVYINRVAPTGMIFIPCKDGLRHNEAESIEKEHAEAGANVLLHALLKLDDQASIPFSS